MTDSVTTSMSTTPGDEKMPAKAVGNRQIKTSNEIIKFLREQGREAPSSKIYDYLNDRSRTSLRNGCTNARLSNILSKNPDFVEVGKVYLKDKYYEVKVWRLADWV